MASAIQRKAIAPMLDTEDLIAQAQSGTGKTATYLLGILNRLEVNNKLQGIVIAPTRELADQVFNVAKELTKKSQKKGIMPVACPSKKWQILCSRIQFGVLGPRSAIADFRWKYRDCFHPCWWTVVRCIVTYLQTC